LVLSPSLRSALPLLSLEFHTNVIDNSSLKPRSGLFSDSCAALLVDV
jgi:hypothetical protein